MACSCTDVRLAGSHAAGTLEPTGCSETGPLGLETQEDHSKADGKVTYCLGMALASGLVLMADTRTNAGVDNFSTFRKLHVLREGEGRQIYAATAGNLSLGQEAIGLVREKVAALEEAPTMFAIARIVGEAVAEVGKTTGAALERAHFDNTLEMLLGGRISDGPLKLFLIYTIGNFIECKNDVPFLQIGETKYGRPILDRALNYETPLAEAVKIGFLSFDSTMESNLGVAHPIDLLVLPSNGGQPHSRRIEEDDDYYRQITGGWSKVLKNGVMSLPGPPWLTDVD